MNSKNAHFNLKFLKPQDISLKKNHMIMSYLMIQIKIKRKYGKDYILIIEKEKTSVNQNKKKNYLN